MSPTIRHKYKYFHATVQRAKDRRQKFHFCRLPFDVRPCNVKLNLSNAAVGRSSFLCKSCGSLIPFTRANAQWVFHGLHIALKFTLQS